MATILTGSRVLNGKKQEVIVLGPGIIGQTAPVMLNYFKKVVPSGVTEIDFDLDKVVGGYIGDAAKAGDWPVKFIVSVSDTNANTAKKYIIPATLKAAGEPPAITQATVLSDMNTAFKAYQYLLLLPQIEITDAGVFVEKIILNVLE